MRTCECPSRARLRLRQHSPFFVLGLYFRRSSFSTIEQVARLILGQSASYSHGPSTPQLDHGTSPGSISPSSNMKVLGH